MTGIEYYRYPYPMYGGTATTYRPTYYNDVISSTTSTSPYYGEYPGMWQQQVVERIVQVETKPKRCEYCHSHCEDERGNCGACGAPLP